MEIFNLPNECKIDKNIPKEMIYKNAEANEKLKRVFIDNVEKIRFMYKRCHLKNEIKNCCKTVFSSYLFSILGGHHFYMIQKNFLFILL